METIIELKSVWKIYDMGEVKVPAVKGVDLEIMKGDFVSIIGASGSGKSTMMNMVGCLDLPTKGRILLKSKDITKMSESDLASLRGKTIGFVFQQYNLIQNMTAMENVLLPLELQEVDDKTAYKKAMEALTIVGLKNKTHHKPNQLSGGQQQRVAIARALANDPEIILADEVTGALDSVTGKEIMNLLHNLWKKEGKTIIMVTHDLKLAHYSHTIIELKDGKILDKNTNRKIITPSIGIEKGKIKK